jgi:murein L,D-transpeptidase YcbB/YkuD
MGWLRLPLLTVFAGIWVFSAIGPVPAQSTALDREIRLRVERLMETGVLWIKAAPVAASHLISEFYVERQFRAAWSLEQNSAALLRGIAQSEAHGLDPEDFHLNNLRALMADAARREDNAPARADLDILMTDALLRLTYMHQFGKVDPVALDDQWNFERPLLHRSPVSVLNEALDGEGVAALIDGVKLANPWQVNLATSLARYRAIASRGGWSSIASGSVLKAGMSDPRVPSLRARLAATGDWQGGDAHLAVYDGKLERAVRRFQKRHGLDVDGMVGARSFQALNVPVEDRIGQILASLERGRWILRSLKQDFVIVNIAAFKTYLVRGGKVIWRARSIVGRDFRKTPVFRDEIRYMEFNPTWTVPPGILANDIVPRMQKDPSYLSRNDFSLIDRNGRRVNPAAVDWSKAAKRGLPYSVVQAPGPKNALGLVKFMFPNPHLVYLHDTPSRGLFGRSERVFSSGCVRVENPFDFAALLLDGQPAWSREKIDRVVASGKTTTVHLKAPLPVLLLYWTAWVDTDGLTNFRRDIYDRDSWVLDALDDAFDPATLAR